MVTICRHKGRDVGRGGGGIERCSWRGNGIWGRGCDGYCYKDDLRFLKGECSLIVIPETFLLPLTHSTTLYYTTSAFSISLRVGMWGQDERMAGPLEKKWPLFFLSIQQILYSDNVPFHLVIFLYFPLYFLEVRAPLKQSHCLEYEQVSVKSAKLNYFTHCLMSDPGTKMSAIVHPYQTFQSQSVRGWEVKPNKW